MPHATESAAGSPQVFPLFSPSTPSNPAQPDFVGEGKVLSDASVAPAASVKSKSVLVVKQPGPRLVTLHVASDQPGTARVEFLLDENERDSFGNPVWRTALSPFSVTAAALATVSFDHIFRQVRIDFTAASGNTQPANVNAWIMSL